MASFDDLPELKTPAFVLTLALLCVFWVYMKVKLLRERIASRAPDEQPPQAAAWIHTLAARRSTGPLLLALALLLLTALVLTTL